MTESTPAQSIRRKCLSLNDLLQCTTRERERFEKEIKRLAAYPHRGLFIESTWDEIEHREWRSKVSPASVIGSLLVWSGEGVPIFMCASHERAGRFVSRFLFIAARRRWREARALMVDVTRPKAEKLSRNSPPPETLAVFLP